MYLVKQGGQTDYNYKEFYLDNEDELNKINKDSCCPGSVAYVVSTQTVYMLNSKKEWIKQ